MGFRDYPNTIQGSLPNTRLGSRGWDKGIWGLGVELVGDSGASALAPGTGIALWPG